MDAFGAPQVVEMRLAEAAVTAAQAPSAAPGAGPAAEVGKAATAPTPPWLDEIAQRVDVYGRFSGHLAFTGDGIDLANNGSRFGLKVNQKLPNGFSVIGHGEWKVNLGQGDTNYSVSENPVTGLGTLDPSPNDALGTRLGYIGMAFGPYGTLTLGKQWGVYYDVSGWGDVYSVFGANGSSTFNAGTDGGPTGEGRANDALIYRVAFGPLKLGVQAQFLDSRERVVDGLGGSVVFDCEHGLRAGVTYSRAFLDLQQVIIGYDHGDAQALTAGFIFDDGAWLLSTLGTWTRNHELVLTDSATVAYDTLGQELFVGYRFDSGWMPYGGLDFAIPRHLDTSFVDPNYGTRDVLGGVRWNFDTKAGSFVYVEGRTGQTRDAAGMRADDVVTLGMRLNYSLRRGLGLDP